MTSTAGTDEHPEVSEISAFDEGILPPDRSADLRGHLAHCLLCTDVRNSLTEIRNLLGTLPGPSRMPADVAGRIDAALAAEALISATTPDPIADSAADPVGEPIAAPVEDQAPRPVDRATASPSHVSRETSAPGAGRPSGHSGASSGPGRTSRRARRRWTVLTAACAAAVLGVGGLLVHSLGSDGSGSTATASGPAGAFSGVRLPDRVHQLLAPVKVGSPKAGSHAGQNTPFSAKVPVVVPACVIKATGRTGTPLASSTGTYEGHSSYLVVLPHPSDAHRVDAYVVDSACVTSGSSAPGKVLTQQTYARP